MLETVDVKLLIPLASGFVGALVGAVANAVLRERSERRTARQELLSEVGIHTKDCISALIEFYRAAQVEPNSVERWGKLAELKRLEGRGKALLLRVFGLFRRRKVRVACTEFCLAWQP